MCLLKLLIELQLQVYIILQKLFSYYYFYEIVNVKQFKMNGMLIRHQSVEQ